MNLKADYFTTEFDAFTEAEWNAMLPAFADASFYQTWAYGAARCGANRVSRMVLRHDDRVVAMAQIRLHKTPFLPFGIAYVQWGPLWQKNGEYPDLHILKKAVTALKIEFVVRRKLTLRVLPALYDCAPESEAVYCAIREAGLTYLQSRCRTLVVDLRPPLEQLHKGLGRRWRQNLSHGESLELTVVDGTSQDILDEYVMLHDEMVRRKRFNDHGSLKVLRGAYAALPDDLRPRVILARHENRAVAGLVLAALGKTGFSVVQATGQAALQMRGASNILEWGALVMLKGLRAERFDLNGINPVANPDTYHFKAGFCGKNGVETAMSEFTCSASPLNDAVVRAGLFVRSTLWH